MGTQAWQEARGLGGLGYGVARGAVHRETAHLGSFHSCFYLQGLQVGQSSGVSFTYEITAFSALFIQWGNLDLKGDPGGGPCSAHVCVRALVAASVGTVGSRPNSLSHIFTLRFSCPFCR